jgi:hypothetical protein
MAIGIVVVAGSLYFVKMNERVGRNEKNKGGWGRRERVSDQWGRGREFGGYFSFFLSRSRREKRKEVNLWNIVRHVCAMEVEKREKKWIGARRRSLQQRRSKNRKAKKSVIKKKKKKKEIFSISEF